MPTMAPTQQSTTAPEADDDLNKTRHVFHSRNNPQNESLDIEDRKPDLKTFKEEEEQDAVVAENEATPEADQDNLNTIRNNPQNASFVMEDRKPDLKTFKEEEEQDAVVAENEATPEADQDDLNTTRHVLHSRKQPQNESLDMEDRKPDMKPFKDEVEQDAVVAENEADRLALLNENTNAKENITEGVPGEENEDAISEENTSDSEALNVSPGRHRVKLVTPFRGRCPICRKYFQ